MFAFMLLKEHTHTHTHTRTHTGMISTKQDSVFGGGGVGGRYTETWSL